MVFNNIVNPCGFDIRFLKTLYYLLRFCALADYFLRTNGKLSDGAKWVVYESWGILSDEWWVMSDEWQKLSNEKKLTKQALIISDRLMSLLTSTTFTFMLLVYLHIYNFLKFHFIFLDLINILINFQQISNWQ